MVATLVNLVYSMSLAYACLAKERLALRVPVAGSCGSGRQLCLYLANACASSPLFPWHDHTAILYECYYPKQVEGGIWQLWLNWLESRCFGGGGIWRLWFVVRVAVQLK